MKYLILDNLCKIETILLSVYDDECACNEGSLTDDELNSILHCINFIRAHVEVYNENSKI